MGGIGYGFTIRWTTLSGREEMTAEGYSTAAAARKACEEDARLCGWTPPRWWQPWRWGDTRLYQVRGEP